MLSQKHPYSLFKTHTHTGPTDKKLNQSIMHLKIPYSAYMENQN